MRIHRNISALLLHAFLLGACVPFPVPFEEPFPDEIVQFIDDGSTTRESALLTLGAPIAARNNDTFFMYAAVETVGGVIMLGGGGSIPKGWFIFMEFDDDGTLVRHEILSKTLFFSIPCTGNRDCIVFDREWKEVPFWQTMHMRRPSYVGPALSGPSTVSPLNADEIESYLSKYPDGVFADYARMRLDCLPVAETTSDAEGTGLDASTKTALEARMKADKNLRTSIKRYYNDMEVRKPIKAGPSGGQQLAVTMSKINDIEALSVSGDLISIAVRFRWEASGESYGRNDREIVTVRKSGSTFAVVEFLREKTMTEDRKNKIERECVREVRGLY